MYFSNLICAELTVNGKNSPSFAFEKGADAVFTFKVSRRLGGCNARVELLCDADGSVKKYPCPWIKMKGGYDFWRADIGSIGEGLYFLRFIIKTASGEQVHTYNVTVYKKGYKTPEWIKGGIMYQIFCDRFARSEKHPYKLKKGAELYSDWENGIPQFNEKPGDPLKNNCFFGGTLYGILEKLDYLQSLGVTTLYLNPIFDAASNHKYDTGDYLKVDEAFGGDEALDELIAELKKRDMHIVLDGVFNHTGDDSVYFNRRQRYGDGGAYNDKNSSYYSWYHFKDHPYEYESWWGIDILPRLDHSNESCRKFFTGEGGVIQKYTEMGIGGWRLDVADELCDGFLDELRERAKKCSDGQAVIIGEVWENAAEKSAYGQRRRYLQGRQLDSVMNYPLRSSIIDFCTWGDAETLYNTLTEIYSSYPRQVSDKLMNIIGTHDTERILTVLGRDMGDEDRSMYELSRARLSADQLERGIKLLKIAAALQYTVYGIPSLYYGDEVGLEGYRDPFCRMPFPWHELDAPVRAEILDFYKKLGRIRRDEQSLDGGDFSILDCSEAAICFMRKKGESRLIVVANRGEDYQLDIPSGEIYLDLIHGDKHTERILIPENSVRIFKGL